MFNHSHIVVPCFSSRIPGMDPHHQTYTVLGQRGQVSGGLRRTAGRRPWENTVQVNFQKHTQRMKTLCVLIWTRIMYDHVGWTDLITFWSHFPPSLLTREPLRTRQWWVDWFFRQYIYISHLGFLTALTLMMAVEQVSKTLACDPFVT